jgi:hypothetical protein
MLYRRQHKIEKPKQKDNWDKADIVAKFISSIVIAGIGIYLTTTIQKTQIDFAKSNAENEVKIKQGTLTSQLIQNLTSTDSNQRKIAVIALRGNLSNDAYNDIIKVIAFSDNNKSVRVSAIEQLGKSNDKSSLSTLTSISLKKNLSSEERTTAFQSSIQVALNAENRSNWCFLGAGLKAYFRPNGGIFTSNLLSVLDRNNSDNLTADQLFNQLQSIPIDTVLKQYASENELTPVLSYGNNFSKSVSIVPDNNTAYLLIGNTKDQALGKASLSNISNFRKVLTTRYKIDEKNIITLNSPTRSSLIQTFDELSKKLPLTASIVLYYSGHSYLSTNNGLMLDCRSNPFTESLDVNLSLSFINSYFSKYKYFLVLWDGSMTNVN